MSVNLDITLGLEDSFHDAGLNSFVVRCLQALNYKHPTPIQYYSIKTYLANSPTIIAQSKSGTGKTLSYISIILSRILQLSNMENRCKYLIVVPTRQLCLQVYQIFKEIVAIVPRIKPQDEAEKQIKQKLRQVRLMMTIGGIPFEDDRKNYLNNGGNVIVGTIGRILQFHDKGFIKISELEMVVLDEGDKLFENKNKRFQEFIEDIIGLKVQNDSKVQFLMYSATFTNKLIRQLANKRDCTFIQTLVNQQNVLNAKVTKNIDEVSVDDFVDDNQTKNSIINLDSIKKYKIAANIEKSSIFNAKIHSLIRVLGELKYHRCLVFVQKKTLLEQINERLISASIQPLLIHGSLSQSSRIKLMNQINHSKVIIASDLLARGIDIELDLVILFDARQNDTFWHRIGRTGRYDKMGVAISLDNIEDWEDYSQTKVQANLDEISSNFNKNKEWYGTYLTEIGGWNEINQQKEAIINQQYRYFQQQKYSEPKMQVALKESLQTDNNHVVCIDNDIQTLSKITSQAELQQFILRLLSCQKCSSFIESIEELTGYKFQIKRYACQ